MNRNVNVSRAIGIILLICGMAMTMIGGVSEKPFVEMSGIIMLLCALSVFTKVKYRSLDQRISKLETKLGES